jgi:hypothetical protein
VFYGIFFTHPQTMPSLFYTILLKFDAFSRNFFITEIRITHIYYNNTIFFTRSLKTLDEAKNNPQNILVLMAKFNERF